MAHRRATDISYGALVRKARRLLDINPCQSRAELASKLCCSESTLNRAFVAAGSTFRHERDRLRLDRAAQALLGALPTAEAARHAAYASSRQLTEPFRCRFGVAPSRMREIGLAVRTVTWQAKQPGPYRGSWQQRQRNTSWRAARRVLRQARVELIPGTMPAQKAKRALELRLPRALQPRAPLTLYEVLAPANSQAAEVVPPRYQAYFRRVA